MAKLSIIVPIYKVEQYLHQCIDSVLKQTFTDFELILVDDGSPDACGEICDQYAEKDCRVQVIHKENGGLSSARNAGLEVANGEYIAFLDSDDYIAPEAYEKMLAAASENNADMVKCGFTEFKEVNKTKQVNFPKKIVWVNDVSNSKLLPLYFQNSLYVIAWNGIYKRELALKVRFPEGYINEDNYSAGLYLLYAKKLVCMDEAFYFYRNNISGLSKVGRTKKPLDIVIVTAKLHEDLVAHGVLDKKFLLKLEEKIARGIFHCVRCSGHNNFRMSFIDLGLYEFCFSRLNWRRRLQLRWYRWEKELKVKAHDK